MKFLKKHKRAFTVLMILGMFMQILAPAGGVFASAEGLDESNDQQEVNLDLDQNEDLALPDNDESSESVEAEAIQPLAEGKNLGDIFTFKSLKVNGAEASENQVVEIGDGTTVDLAYTWAVGSDVKDGDYAEIDVPNAFKLDRDFVDQDIKLNDDKVVGKYSLINNKIKFVFDERIEDVASVENGVLGFGVKFNEEIFTEDVVTDIEFKDQSNKNITIIGKPSVEVSAINKEGIPDSKTDAKTITWKVDLTNPSNEAITDAKLKDILPEGLELDSSSIKVKGLNIKLNGDLSEGNDVTVDNPTIDGQKFELELPSILPYKGYRVEYITTITDNVKTQFTNDASFEHGDKKLPADATVSFDRSGNIEKYVQKEIINDEILWWIDVNKTGVKIENAIVEDTLPDELTLVPESIEIFNLTKGADDKWAESGSDKGADEFPVTLDQINGAYRIKFKTSINYSKVNDGEYQQNNSFTNKTTLKDDEEKIGEAERTVKVTRKPILQKTVKSNVSYDDKTITWTVTVNEANHKIDGAIVTDTLPAGLTIEEKDIIVKNSAGEAVTASITVPANTGANPTKVTINLGDINEKYTIEYITKITDFTQDKFENKASLVN